MPSLLTTTTEQYSVHSGKVQDCRAFCVRPAADDIGRARNTDRSDLVSRRLSNLETGQDGDDFALMAFPTPFTEALLVNLSEAAKAW